MGDSGLPPKRLFHAHTTTRALQAGAWQNSREGWFSRDAPPCAAVFHTRGRAPRRVSRPPRRVCVSGTQSLVLRLVQALVGGAAPHQFGVSTRRDGSALV